MQQIERNPAAVASGRESASFFYDFLSFWLILLAPYVIFVEDSDFIVEAVNVYAALAFAIIAVVLALLLRLLPFALLRVAILSVLLLLFIDIQLEWIQSWGWKIPATAAALFSALWVLRAHAGKILSVVFATIIAAILGAPLASLVWQEASPSSASSETHGEPLPFYVHIVLDEQIGIEGFDKGIPSHDAIRGEIEKLFAGNGFRLFGRAYSPYYDSRDSISSTLNLNMTDNVESLYVAGDSGYELLQNPHFEKLMDSGYDVNIYQSSYMDFCRNLQDKAQKCLTYNHYGFSSAALSGLSGGEKAHIVFEIYVKLSYFAQRFKQAYRNLRGYAEASGMALPHWPDWSGRVGPIPVLPVFDRLIEDVSAAPEGAVFFAHLLIPHFPYSVDRTCEIRRPVIDWNGRSDDIGEPEASNSPASRLARYEDYIPQVHCALSKLEQLFDALKARGDFEDATIIIHGDHGSRIVLVEPRAANEDRLSEQDFHDAFSTLYVVKSPKTAPGYDTRMMSLPELLQDTLSGESDAAEPKTTPSVFLRPSGNPDDAGLLKEVSMPALPITDR